MDRPQQVRDSRFEALLRGSCLSLGAAGRRVRTYILENREAVLASSAAELGSRVGTSDATVVRTIQALGFTGLGDLKRAILGSIGSAPAEHMRRTLAQLDESAGAAIEAVLRAHADGLGVLASESCRRQIAAAAARLDPAGRIVVFGIGPSSALATYVSILLVRGGRSSRCMQATGSTLADMLLDLRKDDALLILAYGFPSKEVSVAFGEARSMAVPTVLVTESATTPIARLADVVIAIPRGRPEGIALHGATLVGLEALVLSLATARPAEALASLDRLTLLRRAIAG